MQRGYFLPIIGMVVLILVVVGILYINSNRGSFVQTPSTISTPQASSDSSVQPDFTKDWNVYVDDTYGFTFKYPKNWNFSKPSLEGKHPQNKTLLQINILNPSFDKNKLLLIGSESDHPSDPDKDPYGITIRVWDNTERKSLKDKLAEIDKFFQNSQQGYCQMLPEKEDAIEHNRCVKNSSGIASSEKILVKGDYLYLISGYPMDSRADYKFNQILTTFKLTW